MGIFEKSIPKYVINPINEQVVVEPQDVYVDDIFDPIFNANVRNAMRQKYGDGLYSVVGGYEELLKNAWGGEGGILGKGMGVLSTFGRSMEKADDIVLGLLTEGVEGISGQGFDNPLEQIFTHDEDYSGKRFLASTANIFRNLAGGTTITEDDLGTAWNIPGLGIDLATDVGILGGNLSRSLAPGASKLTSKQLFENLGKSDIKTTVGEVGQLMSNYDDLMAKVAIDITAPGLRPAFKVLKNKLGQLFATNDPQGYADVRKKMRTVEDDTADPADRKAAQDDLKSNPTVQQLTQLFEVPDSKLSQLPEDTFETAVFEAGAEEPSIDRLSAALRLDLTDADSATRKRYNEDMQRKRELIKKATFKMNQDRYAAIEAALNVAKKFGWETDIDKLLNRVDPEIRDQLRKEGVSMSAHFRHLDTPYRISPSLRSAVSYLGPHGISYSYNRLQDLNRIGSAGSYKFNSPEELENFLSSSDMVKALESFIPVKRLRSEDTVGLSAEDILKKEQAYARSNRSKFIRLLKTVYFPNGVSDYDYTKALMDLEDLLARNANPNITDLETRFLNDLTPEEVARFKKHPSTAYTLKDFLVSKDLVTFDEYDTIEGGVDPAAYYLIFKKYPESLDSNPRLLDATRKRVIRLLKEYNSKLNEISETLNTPRASSKSVKFFERLYDILDDISQTYLQPLRDELPRPLKNVAVDVSLDKPVGDGSSSLGDILSEDSLSAVGDARTTFRHKNRLDEENAIAISRIYANIMANTVPSDATFEQFAEFAEPLLKVMDVNYKTGADIPASPKTEEILNTFKTEVVPLIEKITSDSKYASANLSRVFVTNSEKDTVHKLPKDIRTAIVRLRELLGAPLASSKHPDSYVLNKLYSEVVGSIKKESFKFKPAHGGNLVDRLAKYLTVPRTPSELTSELRPLFENAIQAADISNQKYSNVTELISRFYTNVYNLIDDLGVSSAELDNIIMTARKKGAKALSPAQLGTYRAYLQEVSKVLKQTPYRTYVRDARNYSAETRWKGLTDHLSSVGRAVMRDRHNNYKMTYEYTRLEDIINRELRQSLDSTRKVRYYYTKSDLNFIRSIVKELPENVRDFWNPSHEKGLLKFDVPSNDEAYTFQLGTDVDLRPERFALNSFLKSYTGNIDELKDFKYVDYGKLYTKSGTDFLRDRTAHARLHMKLIEETPAPVEDLVKKIYSRTLKRVSNAREVFIGDALEAPVLKVAEEVYETPSVAETIVDAACKQEAPNVYEFIKKGGSEDVAKQRFPEEWSVYEQVQKASAVRSINANRDTRATLRSERAVDLAKRFEKVEANLTPDDAERFYKIRQKQAGDVLSGDDVLLELVNYGILYTPFEEGSKHIKNLEKSLIKVANSINEAVGTNVVKVVTKSVDNGNVVVEICWNGLEKTAPLVNKAAKKLTTLKFDDIIFLPPSKLTPDDIAFLNRSDIKELSGLMEELQSLVEDQARYIGFEFTGGSPYAKHVMKRSQKTAKWLDSNIYNEGMSSSDFDDLTDILSNLDAFRQNSKGMFGIKRPGRRVRGEYWLLSTEASPVFEYAPTKIFKSSVADGMFANLQYQSLYDFFINDNFKIKGILNTVEDVKEVLYAKLPDGRQSGNLRNLELVSFKTNEYGRVTGLVRYDKLSDIGIEKALADENTILVPSNCIAHMDSLFRKDKRMSNKAWTFMNKHFMTPFKISLLTNPGFLMGNLSDASLKLATTMSEKYGTEFTKEVAQAASCMREVIRLGNVYSDVFDEWMKVVEEYDINIPPEATVPEIVAMSPKYNDALLQWLDGTLTVKVRNPETGKFEEVRISNNLSKTQIDEARVWIMLQGMQMSTSKMRDFAEAADLMHKSKFDVPTNVFDRIVQGSGKYDPKKPSTWGLFMNNPRTKWYTDSSEGIEGLVRTASILDDLLHKNYTYEDISKFSRTSKTESSESRRQFDVHRNEAMNTMYSAQFDYENQSDFTDAVGTAMPFPIFFLKNFAYWMELFFNNPQYVDNAIDVQEGLWQGHNEEDDEFKTEAKGRGAIPIESKALPEWFKGIYKPSPLQSMFGAFNLLNSPVDNLTYRVNPLISGAATAVAEQLPDNELTTLLSNPESVKYRPYSGNMYERNIKRGDPNFNPLEYTLHRANPFDRAMNAHMRIPAKAEEGELQLSDAFPSVFQPIF